MCLLHEVDEFIEEVNHRMFCEPLLRTRTFKANHAQHNITAIITPQTNLAITSGIDDLMDESFLYPQVKAGCDSRTATRAAKVPRLI